MAHWPLWQSNGTKNTSFQESSPESSPVQNPGPVQGIVLPHMRMDQFCACALALSGHTHKLHFADLELEYILYFFVEQKPHFVCAYTMQAGKCVTEEQLAAMVDKV